MVPFSFLQHLLKSRVMKERSLRKMVSGVMCQVSVGPNQRDAGPNCGGTAREDSRPTKGAAWFRGNSVILSKVKITKRTQFKNRTICRPRQPRMANLVNL
jgi:hypothetical protein